MLKRKFIKAMSQSSADKEEALIPSWSLSPPIPLELPLLKPKEESKVATHPLIIKCDEGDNSDIPSEDGSDKEESRKIPDAPGSGSVSKRSLETSTRIKKSSTTPRASNSQLMGKSFFDDALGKEIADINKIGLHSQTKLPVNNSKTPRPMMDRLDGRDGVDKSNKETGKLIEELE